MCRKILEYVALSLLFAPVVVAAEPELKSIFPCGCRVGGSVDVTLAGTELSQATQLIFSRENISAERTGNARFKVSVARDAKHGVCDVWVVTPEGMTGPRRFAIDQVVAQTEKESNDTRESSQEIALPSVTDAKLDRLADLDWYHFDGNQGDEVTIVCRSVSMDGSVEASMRLLGPNGGELLHNKGHRVDPKMSLQLPLTGTYWLRVCDRAYRKDDYSFYRLEIRNHIAAPDLSITEADDNDTIEKAQPLDLASRIVGHFVGRGDIDWYSFHAKKNQSFTIDSFGDRLGQRMDLDIAVHDADGKRLLALGDIAQPKDIPAKLSLVSLDAFGKWKAPADGGYFLAVRDLYGGSVFGPDRHYQLVVSETRPSIRVFAIHQHDAAPRGLWLRQGGTAELQIIAIREGGFSGPIHIRVELSRKGLAAEPCSLNGKETSKMLKLTAAPDTVEGFEFIRLFADAEMDSQKLTVEVQPRTMVRPGNPTITRMLEAIPVFVAKSDSVEK